MTNYEAAREKYAALGVDTDKAIETLKKVPVSLHCWQLDDVIGFDNDGGLTGGIQTTGNYMGRARTPEQLMADMEEAMRLMPGTAKLVAGRLSMYLGHNVEYDDLVSYGIFGLIDAIDKFDLEKNVKFETYASLRIRGAILDQIRKMDWIPRSVRQRQRKIDEAMKQIEMRTGKTASDEELAKQLGLTDEELCSWQTQLKVTNVVSLNEFEETGPEPMIDSAHPVRFSQPEEVVEEEELKEKLAESLELLTEKERRVIELYYYEDMTLKEISKILEVSESRISQLHTKALNKMRKKMGVYMNILTE